MFYYLKNYLFLKADFEFAIPWITLTRAHYCGDNSDAGRISPEQRSL